MVANILIDTTKPAKVVAPDGPVTFDRSTAMADLRARVHATLNAEIEKFSPEQIVSEIITQMRKHEREVTWKILGLDKRFGGWEVDHCNGRISPLSNEIAAACQPMLTEAVSEIGREVVAEMTVNAEARATLKAAFKKELQHKLDRILKDEITAQATKIATALVGGIVTEVKAEAGL